jgi:hypothetical protein
MCSKAIVPVCRVVEHDPGEQQHAGADLDHQVAHAGAVARSVRRAQIRNTDAIAVSSQ